MRTQVSKWGNSLAVRIPKTCAQEAGLADGAAVEVRVAGGDLIVALVHREYSLDQLVAGITPKNRHSETEWSGPVGKEVW